MNLNIAVFITLCFINSCTAERSDKDLFPILPIAPTESANKQCKEDSTLYVESLNNLTLWAYEMWDATAKSTTGSLSGSTYQFGNWHECRKAKAPFKTQYCLAEITTDVSWLEPSKDPYSLERNPSGSVLKRILNTYDASQLSRDRVYMGWCLPASCTTNDLETALNDDFNKSTNSLIDHNVKYQGKIKEGYCQRQGEEKNFNILDGIFCVISVALLLLVLIATLFEFKLKHKLTENKDSNGQDLGRRILVVFSARQNFIDLAKHDESNPALTPLYGIRVLSIFMIILGHKFGLFTVAVLNLDYVEEQYRSTMARVGLRADLYVDTFFVLSGLLLTYSVMAQYKKKIIHPAVLIFLRYMRLTPLFAFITFFYATLYNYIGSGPLWKLIIYQDSQDCRDYWWTNLLYINNYFKEGHLCVPHSWYLGCDFHYFVIGVLLILVLFKNKKVGFALFTLWFVLSVVIPSVIVLVYSRPGMLRFYHDFIRSPKADVDFNLTYIKSHTRANPFLIGMIAGYIYYKLKDSDHKLSKVKSHIITFISFLLLFVAIEAGGIAYDPYSEHHSAKQVIFAGFHRLPWALGTIGILFTTSYGHATFIRKFLSWSPFIPLSRLVYGVYLIHLPLQFRIVGVTASSETFNIFDLICFALGETVVSFMLALVLHIVIEAPIRKMCKILFLSRVATSPPSVTIPNAKNETNTIQGKESDNCSKM